MASSSLVSILLAIVARVSRIMLLKWILLWKMVACLSLGMLASPLSVLTWLLLCVKSRCGGELTASVLIALMLQLKAVCHLSSLLSLHPCLGLFLSLLLSLGKGMLHHLTRDTISHILPFLFACVDCPYQPGLLLTFLRHRD